MTAVIAWAQTTWLGRALSAALAAFVVLGATYTAGRRKGRQAATDKARDRDETRADAIRNRVSDIGRMRDAGDGYRD